MSAPEESADRHLDIRKYPNRRYYDATHSRHLTLEEIRALIRDGYDITVTDSKTGADITAQVLTQIILELETPKIDSFPVELLARMIRSNDQAVRSFVETYFNQAFKAYVEYQKQVEERLRQMQGANPLFPPFSAWTQAAMSPFAAPFAPSGPATSREAKESATAGRSDGAEELHRTVTELQEQLRALRAEMKKGKTKAAGRRKK